MTPQQMERGIRRLLDDMRAQREFPSDVAVDCAHDRLYTITSSIAEDHEHQMCRCQNEACGEYVSAIIWFSRGDNESAVDLRVLAGAERVRVQRLYVEQLQEVA